MLGPRTLSMWFKPRFFTLGPTLGTCCHRKMLTTDASLTGWGAVLDDHPAQGIWRGHFLDWHINCLGMMAVFSALKYILQQGLPCPCARGQDCGSHLHRSPGQTASMPPEQASTAGSVLYVGQVLVHQGDFHSGVYECRSRFAVRILEHTVAALEDAECMHCNQFDLSALLEARFLSGRGKPLCPRCDCGARVSSWLRDEGHVNHPSFSRSSRSLCSQESLPRYVNEGLTSY